MNFKVNKYQIVILWIGIITFAWLCFNPPTKSPGRRHSADRATLVVDVPRLTSYSLAIIVITGGLIFTQPKVSAFRVLKKVVRISLYILGPPLVCWIFMGLYSGDWVDLTRLIDEDFFFWILPSYLLLGYIMIIIKKVVPRWLSIGFGLLVLLYVGTFIVEDNLQKNLKAEIRTELIEKNREARTPQDTQKGTTRLDFSKIDGVPHSNLPTDEAVQITFNERYGNQVLPGLTKYFKRK